MAGIVLWQHLAYCVHGWEGCYRREGGGWRFGVARFGVDPHSERKGESCRGRGERRERGSCRGREGATEGVVEGRKEFWIEGVSCKGREEWGLGWSQRTRRRCSPPLLRTGNCKYLNLFPACSCLVFLVFALVFVRVAVLRSPFVICTHCRFYDLLFFLVLVAKSYYNLLAYIFSLKCNCCRPRALCTPPPFIFFVLMKK